MRGAQRANGGTVLATTETATAATAAASLTKSHTKATAEADAMFHPKLHSQAIDYYFYPNSSIAVFCPTMEQFADFEGLVAAIEPLALRGGVCKIIPPREWRTQLEASGERDGQWRAFSDEEFPIMRPIVQHFNGSSGVFHQYNVEFHRKVRLAQFFHMSQDSAHATPTVRVDSEDEKKSSGEADCGGQVYESASVGIAVDYGTGEIRLTGCAADQIQGAIRSEAKRTRFSAAVARYRPHPDNEEEDAEPASEPNGARAAREFTADDRRALFVGAREYAENEELERVYWKNMLFQPPMYGADVLGTLFPGVEAFPHWNIRALPGLLRRIGQRMPGVNDPYLYLGMWKATFAWHVEDMDLYSINYIHFGAPKAWYAIPIAARARFERVMQNVFATDYKQCAQFLRHKAYLLSPRFLAAQGIPCNRVVQRAGEIVLTFPLGYHAGFNHGFNCAESVNFATERWLDIARKSRHCQCVKDSVTIDLMEWFGGEAKDGGCDRTPRRHAAAKPVDSLPAHTAGPEPSPGRTAAKRKGPGGGREPKQRRAREGSVDAARRLGSLNTPVGVCGGCFAKIAVHGGGATQAVVECQQCGLTVHPSCSALTYDDGKYKCANCLMDTDQLACALCPFQNGLLLPVSGGHEFAHFLCANFVNETYFDFHAGGSSAQVCGIHNVPKARWSMRCMLCDKGASERHFGAIVQCAHPKCYRAFHPMCAAVKDPSGLLDWAGCRAYCPQHRRAALD